MHLPLAEHGQLRELGPQVGCGELCRPLRGEQTQGPPVGGPDQFGQFSERIRRDTVPSRVRQAPSDVEDALLGVVERRPHVQPTPLGRVAGLGILVDPVAPHETDAAGHRLEGAPQSEGRRGENRGVLSQHLLAHQTGDRQRCHMEFPPEALMFAQPDDVMFAQLGHPLGDVENLPHRGGGLRALRVRGLPRRWAHRRDGSPGGLTHQLSALNCQRFWFGDAARRYFVERCGEAIGHFEQFEAQVIVQPFRGTPGDALDLLGRQLTAGRTRDPADQFVRLVDDHRVVFGQRGSTMHRVDGQERVVGDDQIGLSCPRPGGLHEAFRPVRAFGGAQALPDGYRNLGPCAR